MVSTTLFIAAIGTLNLIRAATDVLKALQEEEKG